MSYIPSNVREWEANHPSVEQLRKECERIKAENALLRGDLSKWSAACDASRIGLVLPLPPLVEALHKELEQARGAITRTIALEERFSTTRAGHLPECPCERCMLARELLRDAARLRSLTATSPGAGAGG